MDWGTYLVLNKRSGALVRAVKSLVLVAGLQLVALSIVEAQATFTTLRFESFRVERTIPVSSEGFSRLARPRVENGELAVVGLIFGGAVFAATQDVPDPLDCGPCDRSGVFFLDRWAITGLETGVTTLSDVLLVGLAGTTWAGLLRGPDGFSQFRASIESVVLAISLTEGLKNATGRHRPFTFTDDATTVTGVWLDTARRSFPSGHTSMAFSAGTSYLLSRGAAAGRVEKIATVAAMSAVGVGRVVGGAHFPTDVLAGAALGALSALLVHEIRF